MNEYRLCSCLRKTNLSLLGKTINHKRIQALKNCAILKSDELDIARKYLENSFPKCFTNTNPLNRGNLLDFGAGTVSLAEISQSWFQIKPDCVQINRSLLKLIKQKKI
jgi:hypothetical protein